VFLCIWIHANNFVNSFPSGDPSIIDGEFLDKFDTVVVSCLSLKRKVTFSFGLIPDFFHNLGLIALAAALIFRTVIQEVYRVTISLLAFSTVY
jgi:uncharacterized membrane protein